MIVAVMLLALGFASAEGSQDPSVNRDLQPLVRLAIDGEYEEALSQFERKLRARPKDSVLNYYVGLLHLYLKNAGKARIFLKASIGNDAPFPKAYYWLAQAWLADDRIPEASEVVLKGLEKFPRNKGLLELAAEMRAASNP